MVVDSNRLIFLFLAKGYLTPRGTKKSETFDTDKSTITKLNYIDTLHIKCTIIPVFTNACVFVGY